MKEKIAISLSRDTLNKIDKTIDKTTIRSRSQAIEMLIKKGMASQEVDSAVILLSREHTPLPSTPFKGSTILDRQISMFRKNGISRIYILAQGDLQTEKAVVIRTKEEKNGDALRQIKGFVKGNFIVMSGDVYADFDLQGLVEKHASSGKMATIGLRSSSFPVKYGTAVLEGDFVTEFQEKPKKAESHIINAGIYVFSPQIFKLMKGSIERNVLPELARKRELTGYFTSGEYMHFGEN